MNPRELLALLTARVQRFHLAPGGIPNLTAEDIAHALGNIRNDDAVLYARVKFCGQSNYSENVARSIRRRFLERAADENWRIPRHGFLLDLSYLLFVEAIDPRTCPWCAGTAELRPEGMAVIVCEACNGTGRRAFRDTDRSRLVGVSPQSWANIWGARYSDMQADTVDKWEDLFVGALKKRLSAWACTSRS